MIPGAGVSSRTVSSLGTSEEQTGPPAGPGGSDGGNLGPTFWTKGTEGATSWEFVKASCGRKSWPPQERVFTFLLPSSLLHLLYSELLLHSAQLETYLMSSLS